MTATRGATAAGRVGVLVSLWEAQVPESFFKALFLLEAFVQDGWDSYPRILVRILYFMSVYVLFI